MNDIYDQKYKIPRVQMRVPAATVARLRLISIGLGFDASLICDALPFSL
jgi:hypothetical protein